MSDISPIAFGHLQAEVAELRRVTEAQTTMLATISGQMQDMQNTMAEAQGGVRTLLLLGGACAAAGALLTKAVLWFASLPLPR